MWTKSFKYLLCAHINIIECNTIRRVTIENRFLPHIIIHFCSSSQNLHGCPTKTIINSIHQTSTQRIVITSGLNGVGHRQFGSTQYPPTNITGDNLQFQQRRIPRRSIPNLNSIHSPIPLRWRVYWAVGLKLIEVGASFPKHVPYCLI